MLGDMANNYSLRISLVAFAVPFSAFLCSSQLMRSAHAGPPASDWMTWPSTYTHDVVYAQPVDQFAQPVEPVAPYREDFQRSGYRNFRSTIQAGQSADNVHIVEQWGGKVEPYEQWRFPFRPYGVPYDAWGPPTPYGLFNGLGGGYGPALPYGGYPPHANSGFPPGSPPSSPPGMNPGMHPGMFPGTQPGIPAPGNPAWPGATNGNPVQPNGFPLVPPYQPAPWYDGYYPSAPPLGSAR